MLCNTCIKYFMRYHLYMICIFFVISSNFKKLISSRGRSNYYLQFTDEDMSYKGVTPLWCWSWNPNPCLLIRKTALSSELGCGQDLFWRVKTIQNRCQGTQLSKMHVADKEETSGTTEKAGPMQTTLYSWREGCNNPQTHMIRSTGERVKIRIKVRLGLCKILVMNKYCQNPSAFQWHSNEQGQLGPKHPPGYFPGENGLSNKNNPLSKLMLFSSPTGFITAEHRGQLKAMEWK